MGLMVVMKVVEVQLPHAVVDFVADGLGNLMEHAETGTTVNIYHTNAIFIY